MFVKIKNTGEKFTLNEGESLLDTLRREGVPIRSSCGGFASCGDCVVKMKVEHECLNLPNFEEKKLLGNVYHITKERLSCQVLPTEVQDEEVFEIEIVNLD